MISRQRLVNFERPPVERAIISIACSPLSSLRASHIGAHWAGIADTFPNVVEFQASPPDIEQFDDAALGGIEVDVTYGDTVPVPRVVAANDEHGRQLAFQRDLFEVSWRRSDGDPDYPRFDALAEEFESQWLSWLRTLGRFGLDRDLRPLQVGFTFQNRIPRDGHWESLEDLRRLFRLPVARERSGQLDVFHYHEHETVIDDLGLRRRVHLSFFVAPGETRGDSAASLTLICRGPVRASLDPSDVTELLQSVTVAHDYTVKAFLAATTSEAQALWGRTGV